MIYSFEGQLISEGNRSFIEIPFNVAESIPDSQLVFINGNHFIANKRPEEFNRAVLSFLTD